jgi:hypothetical protein
MTRSDLGQNQIIPAARPVDAFIRPAQQNVAAPAQLQMMPNPGGIRTIGQGSGGNVGGVNQWQELAQALAPFSRDLVQLGGAGLELYASSEYEKGRSEAMRAAVLANQQMQQSQAQYAAENRKLDKADPIAAMMMDRVNPFREGGRQNSLARVAGQRILPAVMDRYRNTPNVAELDIGSPELKRIEAQAVQDVVQRFGLNEGSPGFIEHVLPQIGQAGMKLYERHVDDRVKHLKETSWRQASVEVGAIYERARTSGEIEWTEFDPVSGRQIKRVAQLGKDRAAWERGIQILAAQTGDRLANETGITGEPSALKRQMFVRLAEMAELSGNPELKRILLSTEVGPPDKNGRRALAGEFYGIEMFEEGNKIAQATWQQQQRAADQGVQTFESELAVVTQGMPDGPERGQAINNLVRKYQRAGVPLNRLMESTKNMSSTLDAVAGRSYDRSGMDALLMDMQGRVGPLWDPEAATRELEANITNVAPQDRDQVRQRFADIYRSKEKEKDDVPGHLVTPLITAAIKSRLRWAYPTDVTEASLRGSDITSLLAWGDADIARSAQLQLSAYQAHVYARIAEATKKKGASLTVPEITSVASRALEEYGKNDKENFDRLFPGSDQTNQPSVSGKARPPRTGGSGAGTPAKPAPTVYPSGQLDNLPRRKELLQSGQPVLALPSVQEEVARVYNGQAPSAAVIRAARDAGYGNNVGQWLLREAENFPTYKIAPDVRKRLLRSSRDAQGVIGAERAAAAPPSPIASTMGWFFNALTGTTAATAAPMVAMREGGGRNGGGPFMDRGNTRGGFGGQGDPGGLASLISSGEGGFNSFNRGTTGSAGTMNLTSMTIGQVRQLQRSGRVSAVGFAQWMPNGQLDKAMTAAGLSSADQFSPANQVKMFWGYVLQSNKQPALREYLLGRSDNLNAAHTALANEWAGMQGPSGRGHYDNDKAGNFASVKAEKVRRALIAARRAISGR